MRIFAISDTHFSLDPTRNMEGFGPIWKNHQEKILSNAKKVIAPGDILLIGGDISWEHKLDQALVHLRQLNDLPGFNKLFVKGNHDHWCKNLTKLKNSLPQGLQALMGNAVKLRGQVFAGTRGWLAPNDPCADDLDQKTFEKEMALLRQALDQAIELKPAEGIHLLLHFPPFTTQGETTPFWDLLQSYPVATCTYGHFHMAAEWEAIPTGKVDGIACQLTAADYLNMTPYCIWDAPGTPK